MYPDGQPFAEWAKAAPRTTSFADQPYNSLNAFRFIDAAGQSRLVRWSLQPTVSPYVVPSDTLASLGPDFLGRDLKRRLAQNTLAWHLIS